ncbi:MAG TPA: ATP-binding protein [Bacteroidales bacterium]|nr:ATP-binding protein [Bacteroidales bacterium]
MGKKYRFKKPRNITFISIWFFYSLIVIAGGIFYYSYLQKEADEKVNEELSAIADLKAGQIERWMKERVGDGHLLMKNKMVSEAVDDLISGKHSGYFTDYLRSLMEAYRVSYVYRILRLADSQIRILMASPSGDSLIGNPAGRDVAKAISENRLIISDFHSSPVIPYPHIDMVVPIRRNKEVDTSAFAAMVFVISPQETLYPLIESWPTPSKTSETLLVRREGDSVLFLNELRHFKETALKLRLPLTDKSIPAVRAALGFEGSFKGKDYRGVPVITNIRRIKGTNWYMVAKVDSHEIYTPLRFQAGAIIIICLLLIVAAGFATGYLRRNLETRYYQLQYETEKERAAAETRYREQYNILRGLNESSEMPIFSLDRNYRYTSFNSAHANTMKKIYDTSPDLGVSIFDCMTNESDRELAKKNIDRALAGEKVVEEAFSGEQELQRIYFEETHNPIVNDSNEVVGVAVVVRDLTRRKQMENELRRMNEILEEKVKERTAQLEAANRELEAFSYSVSHDLRAPLRAIHSFTSILREDYGNRLNEEGLRICDIIESSSVHLGQLIDDLLAFSRVGRATMKPVRIDMEAIAGSVYNELLSGSEGRDVKINIMKLPRTWGDATTIRLVWTNLISNALKYTSKNTNTEITIGYEQHKGETIYYVKDNGVGFDMKYYHKLFGVFQRLHSQKEFEGNGVGLAIVYRIISRHGGKVWAESKPGEGSVFFFSLPSVKPNEAEQE